MDNRIKKHNISTKKSDDGNEKRIQIVDFIAHCGEPENNGTPTGTAQHNGSEQSSTVRNGEKEQVRTPSPAGDQRGNGNGVAEAGECVSQATNRSTGGSRC